MHWVYDLPNWLFGVLTVLVFCAFGLGGMILTRRWVPSLHHSELSHNDIVGFYFGAIAVFYGVTLGLLMVAVWQNFSETAQKVDREAGRVAAFYRNLSSYPEPSRSQLQNDLRRYTRNVIDVAWPQQQKGIVPAINKAALDDLGSHLATFEPASEGQKILHSESIHKFSEIVELRRSRHLSVTAGLSGPLWALLWIGALINIAVTWSFHVKNRRMHLWMTTLVSSLLGLMVFLLAEMDHPFMGRLSVSSEPFQLVYKTLMQADDSAVGSGNARTQ
jgi:hypothetical protein